MTTRQITFSQEEIGNGPLHLCLKADFFYMLKLAKGCKEGVRWLHRKSTLMQTNLNTFKMHGIICIRNNKDF